MNHHTKRFFYILIALLSFGFGEKSSFAQGNVRIIHTQQKEARSDTYLGRDLWFAIPQNYDPSQQQQKYFNIYVTSARNATINFQVGGSPVIQRPVTAGQVVIFKSPTPTSPGGDITLGTELQSSGVVENRSVHIWSNEADISVYFLSRVPYSTGGMYVIPTTGWGKEYVVGGYASLVIPPIDGDFPSEFVVVSNQDNTNITITPTTDLRKDGFPTVVEHRKGVGFVVSLNKGECIQYQVVGNPQDETWDVTGTTITSNNPVGVIGGSVCPYITITDPSCDYVLTMLQPIRAWSNSYFTCPFAGRKYGGDIFLVVATKDNQSIMRNGQVVATLVKNGFFFTQDVTEASLWSSDTSFQLIQYIPSSTHSAPSVSNRNEGDPDMVAINPANQYSKTVIFQTPKIDPASGQTEFINYVNILLPINHESITTYDGHHFTPGSIPNISQMQRLPIPNTSWEAIRLTYTKFQGEGTHTVVSDTGVGVYLYGYGTDDSYSWSGALGTKSVNDPDTIPPVAIAGGPCFCAHVRLFDTGPGQSKLSDIRVDSAFNMTFYPDPTFVAGTGRDSSYYDMCVIDSTIDAYLSISTYDLAGNRTTVISTYKPQFVKFSPSPLNFGTVNVGNTAFKYDTICNTGQNIFHFKSVNLNLSNGTKTDALGFTIDSAADTDIPIGGCIVVKIKFASLFPPTVRDTMTLVDECVKIPSSIIGNGGAADFDIGNYSFDCTPLNAGRPSVSYFVTDPSGIPIVIDSVWLDDNINFGYDNTKPAGNVLPFTVPPTNLSAGQHEIIVTFNPQSLGSLCTIIHVRAKIGHVLKTAKVCGLGCGPDIISAVGTGQTDCGNPYSFKVPLQNKGTLFDSLISVKGFSTSAGFSAVKIEDALGNPLTLPYHIDSSAVIYATLDYTPPAKACGVFTDTITVTSGGEGPVRTEVTVKVKYREAALTKGAINYGTLPFGGAKVQDFFTVCNNKGCDSLVITSIPQLSAPNPSSFSLSNIFKIGALNVTLPVGLAPGECLNVYVDFDPAKSNITTQLDSFGIVSNACNGALTANVQGALSTAPPPIQGFSDPALFSCDTHTDSVTLTNINPSTTETITAITIVGADQANFASTLTPPIIIAAAGTLKIPVLFTPVAQAGQRTYTAWVKITVKDGAGNIVVDSALVTAIGQGINLTVASQFANPVDTAGTTVFLPIQLSVNKNGLNTPLSAIDITRIELTYAYDQNILDIVGNNIKGAVKFNNPAWSVDVATSKIDIVAGTLQLNIIGPALTDADLAQPLGTIAFRASLPKTGSATDVKLTTANFINGSSQLLSACTAIAKKDSTFGLIYACGDSSLQKFMNGVTPLSAYPVHPNPGGSSNGSILSFKHASRVEGIISLVIFDELGKEVARVIHDESLPAGTFEVRYNASGLSEGSYIYRYVLNNQHVASGRFVIQK